MFLFMYEFIDKRFFLYIKNCVLYFVSMCWATLADRLNCVLYIHESFATGWLRVQYCVGRPAAFVMRPLVNCWWPCAPM